ncbi:MAG: thermonuclease family protein [Nocardioidaceae bacterium]
MTTTSSDLYRYAATILDWHDGDTAHADVDLGCHVHWRGSLRTAGYNAPELTGATKAAGEAATAYVGGLIPPGSVVYLDSLAFSAGSSAEEDHFGRMLAAVTLPDGRDLAALMIGAGQAVPDPA